ncbi:DUF3131 domain-containing protein [Pseudooceanicola algae]|uniref:DUF3131 domain-containing protein n=1 Tax=Pseudooceanicola algae TaxID=1537215 RepID=A0A418SCP8_9RHOB|nr:DUF3131 domain-containing protein [Pseudooceanicola algae]QPM92252.1 hypothetical protein PSAL_035160 [Pseudooceanicola algae]
MSFRDNLIKARSGIIFLVALFCGLGLVISLEGAISKTTPQAGQPAPHGLPDQPQETLSVMSVFEDIDPLPLAITGDSTPEDLAYARIAWTYFENNTNADTGLVNSADQYPSTTMWETGSYFIAVISADLLGLIEKAEATARISRALDTLATMRLFDDILPNKAYNVQTGALVDYTNQPVERGLGWSALDIARMIGALSHVEQAYPDLAGQVASVLEYWDVDEMVEDGQLIGGNMVDGELRRDQEGRLGYGQYAAKAMMLYGYDMYRAYRAEDHMMVEEVMGQPIPVDDRLHRNVTPAFTVSEPYVFDGLEFGFDARSHRFATAIYKAQEERYRETGTLTAVSESHLDEAPYFVYSTIWGGGAPWAVMTFRGERLDSKRTVTVKTAFAWYALFGTEYTQTLIDALAPLGDEKTGWPEGLYEVDGSVNSSVTTNTNAVVLAALAFRAHGPLGRANQ